VAAHDRLDIVFANAGIDSGPGFVTGWAGSQRARNPDGALETYSDERWNRVIDVNLGGVFATLRAAARLMKPQRSGKLIVTTSVAAYQCEPAIGSAYMAAKAGAAHFMRCDAHGFDALSACQGAEIEMRQMRARQRREAEVRCEFIERAIAAVVDDHEGDGQRELRGTP